MKLPCFRSAAISAAIAVLTVLALACLASAQDLDTQSLAPNNRVKTVPITPVKLAPGTSTKVRLPFEVARGYHINSNQPQSDLLLPTTVKLDPPTDILAGKIIYPAGQDLTFPFAPDEKLNVYTGDFTVSALIRAARTMPAGRYRVRGTLKYQACDDKACYPPAQTPLAFDVQITRAKAKATARRPRRNPPQSPNIHP
jgi:hypothetical protein